MAPWAGIPGYSDPPGWVKCRGSNRGRFLLLWAESFTASRCRPLQASLREATPSPWGGVGVHGKQGGWALLTPPKGAGRGREGVGLWLGSAHAWRQRGESENGHWAGSGQNRDPRPTHPPPMGRLPIAQGSPPLRFWCSAVWSRARRAHGVPEKRRKALAQLTTIMAAVKANMAIALEGRHWNSLEEAGSLGELMARHYQGHFFFSM